MAVTFKSLTFLSERVIKALNNLSYFECSPIQEKAISALYKNKSILALAPTGSGKTLAYMVPIFNDLDIDKNLQDIIVVPTSALGNQIYSVFQSFKKEMNLNTSITLLKNENDLNSYKNTAQILIVTPSIFANISKSYNMKDLKRVIVDEADMIAFDGFDDNLVNIKQNYSVPISLFSATLNEHEVSQLKKLMHFDVTYDVRENNKTSANVTHHIVDIKHFTTYEALIKLLNAINPYKTIIFVSKNEDLDKISKQLFKDGVDHIVLSGQLNKREIKNAMYDFKDNKSYILLSSDFGARGLDIDDVDTIISVDLPANHIDYYYHRAGRTGRFNNKGNSYVLAKDGDKAVKSLLEKDIKFVFHSLTKDGMKDETKFAPKGRPAKAKNEKLEQEIKRVARKTRSTKVKPCYKKKVRWAVEQVKRRHKEKIIKTNIRKKEASK